MAEPRAEILAEIAALQKEAARKREEFEASERNRPKHDWERAIESWLKPPRD